MNDFIYLDYNATTPVDQRVVDTMLPFFNSLYANAGSSHLFGLTVKEAIDEAGEKIAELITADPKEIIYTSGATEVVNLALKGIEKANGKNHIITVKTEHKAVLDTCIYLEKQGFLVTYLDVGKDGLIDLDELKNVITDKTLLVCVMFVNNETGVIQPIKEIAEIAHDKNCLVFCDATQAVGKVPVNVKDLGIDLMPYIEKKYKTNGRKAIAGLSRGSYQAMLIGVNHPEVFSAIGSFSPVIYGGTETQPFKEFPIGNLLKSKKRPLFFIGVGDKEDARFLDFNKTIISYLDENNYPYSEYRSAQTYHEWLTWRRCLHEFAQKIFK
ncbi:aminotransferase class V-fold PLP-dependent enzyme [Epilithonimonas ginsengisoli]|uniref:Aminotransferase class V-fold PLP-dependent enzyme n=1 Tax=Epilithonimonas ginsengisoli TaxID=1245592 RepID=A0ABU4JLS0_9FLAO|nr:MULTISPECIES: aminotransferase class V-fold PLP-dependent enzyme [Chryseobacterium group]MBV6881631.1 aminotransferase class V-fold PLP-dependent enzyme [Epilithonimonas sp. FP105]MDW8550610.1 aminotransferase class V-fold PLP-dependent enzyme [Epilithonimonas ginsengisoli]OAH73787.1 hypothetical protein AXA65_07100 [Chryseobacterium sp. FP211-J200]